MFSPLQVALGIQVALVVLVLVLLVGTYVIIKAAKPLIVNALIGLLVILVADVLGFGVVITPLVVILVALGGVPAAVLVIVLAHVDVVFETSAAILPAVPF